MHNGSIVRLSVQQHCPVLILILTELKEKKTDDVDVIADKEVFFFLDSSSGRE